MFLNFENKRFDFWNFGNKRLDFWILNINDLILGILEIKDLIFWIFGNKTFYFWIWEIKDWIFEFLEIKYWVFEFLFIFKSENRLILLKFSTWRSNTLFITIYIRPSFTGAQEHAGVRRSSDDLNQPRIEQNLYKLI